MASPASTTVASAPFSRSMRPSFRRTIRFLQKMEYTILSGHRRIRPFGMAGGEDGQIGENWVRRNDGRMDRLKGADATVVDAGEAIIIQTPTAGGYGKPG